MFIDDWLHDGKNPIKILKIDGWLHDEKKSY